MVAVEEPPRSRVAPVPPLMVAIVEGFWLVAMRLSLRVSVPVPRATTGPVGAVARVAAFQPPTFQPRLLMVRPARVLLAPASVKVD